MKLSIIRIATVTGWLAIPVLLYDYFINSMPYYYQTATFSLLLSVIAQLIIEFAPVCWPKRKSREDILDDSEDMRNKPDHD